MRAVHSEPVPLPQASIWPLSVAAYRALGEAGLIPKDTELLYGVVYRKMSKSPLHSFLVTRLLRLLQAHLPPGCLLRCEQPITCGDSEPEPDLSVIRGSEEAFHANHPTTAELVVEVYVSSHDYDRSKLRAYAAAGIREVWLVLAPERQVEVFQQPDGESYASSKVHGPGGELRSTALPSLSVNLNALFPA